jgi:SAM-dependent methyltransferase/uncharacterized protein YbaR (Trm112 family)
MNPATPDPMPNAATSLLERDAAEMLRCPACHAPELAVTAPGRAACPRCDTAYPGDAESGICRLIDPAADEESKADIQRWWGDLFRQAYADHAGLDRAELDRLLDALEELFHHRRMLPVIEMPVGALAGLSVLEIGAGAGGHSAFFMRRGASVTAIDITPERVAGTARKLALLDGEGRCYQADAENLPFRDNSFDIVYSNGVLHHSTDTVRAVAEAYRVLKPGGLLVIMLYARHSATYWLNILPRGLLTGAAFRLPEAQWIGRLTEGKPSFGETRNPFTRVYSRRQLRSLLADFTLLGLRRSSFQFDNFCIPRLTQIRHAVLRALGHAPHPGARLVYGGEFIPETRLELALGRHIGFAWNVLAKKPEEADPT